MTSGAGADTPRGRLLYAERGAFHESYLYDADGRLAQIINGKPRTSRPLGSRHTREPKVQNLRYVTRQMLMGV